MARRFCDVCGVRPATITIRRIVPAEGQRRIEHLCEIHAAQARGGRSPLGGGSLFDDFFTGFLETPGGHTAPRRESPACRTAPSRQAEQVDVTQFFSDATTELLQRAAQQAVEWGSLDLTSEHLLHAALEDEVVWRVLEAADADPESIRAQLEEDADKDKRTDVAPSLAPDAKRALLAAYEESRALDSSYIGPEHALLALAKDEESEAGRLLSRFGVSHTKLRGAVVRGVDKRITTRAGIACGKARLTAPRLAKPSARAGSLRNTTVGGPVRAPMRSTLALPRVSTLVSGPARPVLRGAGWRGHVLYGL